MVQKCKTLSKLAQADAAKMTAKMEQEAVPEEEDQAMPQEPEVAQEEAAPKKRRPAKDAEAVAVEEARAAAKAQAAREAEVAAARHKELKAMALDDLKEVAAGAGLDAGKKKTEMIEALLKLEAKQRAAQRAREAETRAVVVAKTEELEATSLENLKVLCVTSGISGMMQKRERVERLLKHWQDSNGIEKALAKIASDKREAALNAMEKGALLKSCNRAGVEPFLREVAIDRIIRRETELGNFAPPVTTEKEQQAPRAIDSSDLVAVVLANEAERAQKKADEERRRAQEEALQKKKQALGDLTVTKLKQLMKDIGVACDGNKEEMVEALLEAKAAEEALTARRAELKALGKDGLKDLLASRGLEKTGGVGDMVDAVMAEEARRKQEVVDYKAKVVEKLAKLKEDLDGQTNVVLKEKCAAKGLSVGKEGMVPRLLQAAQECGEIDASIVVDAQGARRATLATMDKAALAELCKKLDVDPLIREVMVERLLTHERQLGAFAAGDDGTQPAAKRQRTQK